MFTQSGKKIILIRHAKALPRDEWKDADMTRPLSERGKDHARILGQYLRLVGLVPDVIIASPAFRTFGTARMIADRFDMTTVFRVESLWDIPSRAKARKAYLDVLRSQDDEINTVIIVGHNPDISEAVRMLSGGEAPEMKTGGLAVLTLLDETSWASVSEGSAEFVHYTTPKFLQFEQATDE